MPHLPCHLALWALFTLSLGVPTLASGQEIKHLTEEAQAQVAALINQAKEHYDAGQLSKAAAALEQAYVIFPNPKIQRRLGEIYTQMGRPEKATLAYKLYLNSAKNPSDQATVRAAIAALAAPKTPTPQSLSVTTSPAGATVRRGDTEEILGTTPLSVELPPGTYQLQVTKPGHQSLTRSVVIAAEAAPTPLRLDLLREEAPPAPPQPPPQEGTSPAVWALAGAGGLSAAASITLFVLARQIDAELDETDANRSQARPADYDERVETRNTLEISSYVTAGLAVGALGAAAWLWASGSDTEQEGLTLFLNPDARRVSLGWHLSF